MKGQKIELVDIDFPHSRHFYKIRSRKEFKTIKEAIEYGKECYGHRYHLEVWVDGKVHSSKSKYFKTFKRVGKVDSHWSTLFATEIR